VTLEVSFMWFITITHAVMGLFCICVEYIKWSEQIMCKSYEQLNVKLGIGVYITACHMNLIVVCIHQ